MNNTTTLLPTFWWWIQSLPSQRSFLTWFSMKGRLAETILWVEMRSKSTTPTLLVVIVKAMVTLSQCAIENMAFPGTVLTRMPKV